MRYSIVFILVLILFSCENPEKSDPYSLKVILDTDMGSDCDDVGALAMLNEYANQGKVEILGVIYSSGAVPYGTGVIDAINRYYGNDNIPLGANYSSDVGDPTDKMQAEKLSRDTVAYKNRYIHNTDVSEQTNLLRRILSEEETKDVIYISIGHTKALYDLCKSKPDSISTLSGFELVQKKIKKWVALGALKANNPDDYYTKDWNFFFNGTAEYTKYLVDSFPCPTFFIDAGSDIMTGKSLAGTPAGNIVRTAYRDWLWNVEKKTLYDQRPSWDLMAVYYAVEEPSEYFTILENGYLEFHTEKGCRWISQNTLSRHHFVMQNEGYEAELTDYLNYMICKPE